MSTVFSGPKLALISGILFVYNLFKFTWCVSDNMVSNYTSMFRDWRSGDGIGRSRDLIGVNIPAFG